MPIAVTNTAHFNRPEFNRQVTHGDQLTIYDVGPWALQAQYPGDVLLAASPALPGRGYYRFDEPAEFLSSTPWPADANDSNPSILNDPDLHAGVVTGAPVMIDGYSIPVGTYILQFYEWPDNSEFYAQTTGYLFDGGLYIGPGAGAYVFRNCVIQGKAASWLIFAFEGGTSFLFEDCTFRWKAGDALSDNGAGVIQSLVSPPATIPGAIIRRCDISGKADGIQLAATSTIEDCYIHDLVWAGTPPDNTHNDGVQFYEGDLTLTGCYFDVGAQAPYSNSCCFFQSATIGNVLAEGNYFNGGGYSYYVQNGTHTVRNNTFGPEHLFGTHAFEGAGWALAEWSGNVDHLGSPVSF